MPDSSDMIVFWVVILGRRLLPLLIVRWPKIILIGFVSFIFGQILPNVQVSNVTLIAQVAVMVAVNALFSQWLVRRNIGWDSPFVHFMVMLGVNLVIALLMILILPVTGSEVNVPNILFFLLLITLIVTLYDRYRPVYDAHLAAQAG